MNCVKTAVSHSPLRARSRMALRALLAAWILGLKCRATSAEESGCFQLISKQAEELFLDILRGQILPGSLFSSCSLSMRLENIKGLRASLCRLS